MHKSFGPLFNKDASAEAKSTAKATVAKKFDWLTTYLGGKSFLMGNAFTVADAYLFTILNWPAHAGIDLSKWPVLTAYHARIALRPKVQQALKEEGLLK